MPDAQKRGIVRGAGDLRPEFGGELAVDGRRVDADFLKHAAIHEAHDAAAAIDATVVLALPGAAHEAAGRPVGEGRTSRQIVLDPLEGGADVVADLLEPLAGGFLAALQIDGSHARYPFKAEA